MTLCWRETRESAGIRSKSSKESRVSPKRYGLRVGHFYTGLSLVRFPWGIAVALAASATDDMLARGSAGLGGPVDSGLS